LSENVTRFFLNEHSIPDRIEDRSFIDKKGIFRKRIEFEIKDKISIFLKEGISQPQYINGFPFLIDDLIDI
jgi:hypothetical protein